MVRGAFIFKIVLLSCHRKKDILFAWEWKKERNVFFLNFALHFFPIPLCPHVVFVKTQENTEFFPQDFLKIYLSGKTIEQDTCPQSNNQMNYKSGNCRSNPDISL